MEENSYKEDEEVKKTTKEIGNISADDNSQLWTLCNDLKDKMNEEPISQSQVNSAITALTVCINGLKKDNYDGILHFQIPQMLVHLFSSDFSSYIYRPVCVCIRSLYEKVLSTHEFFESSEFIEMLVDNDPITDLTDYKMLILNKILNETKNKDLSKELFETFPLDSISKIISSTSNDTTISALFDVVKILSQHIENSDDSQEVLTIIKKNLKRGRQKSVIAMIEILLNFLRKDIFPLDKFNELSLGESIAQLIGEPLCNIDNAAAVFLTSFMEKYQSGYPIDVNKVIENMLQQNNPTKAMIFAKLLAQSTIVNNSIPLYLFEKDILPKFFCELDSYSAAIKSYILIICIRCLYTANIANIQLIVEKIGEDLLFKPILLGLENGSDYVVLPTLHAINSLVNLYGKDEAYNKLFDDHFYKEIPFEGIDEYTNSENEEISELASTILANEIFKNDD